MNFLPITICLILIANVLYSKIHQAQSIDKDPQRVLTPALQTILDTSDVTGAILIYDPQAETYYSNSFEAAEQGHLPASTYKIPHSIIALETGVVEDDSTLFP